MNCNDKIFGHKDLLTIQHYSGHSYILFPTDLSEPFEDSYSTRTRLFSSFVRSGHNHRCCEL